MVFTQKCVLCIGLFFCGFLQAADGGVSDGLGPGLGIKRRDVKVRTSMSHISEVTEQPTPTSTMTERGSFVISTVSSRAGSRRPSLEEQNVITEREATENYLKEVGKNNLEEAKNVLIRSLPKPTICLILPELIEYMMNDENGKVRNELHVTEKDAIARSYYAIAYLATKSDRVGSKNFEKKSKKLTEESSLKERLKNAKYFTQPHNLEYYKKIIQEQEDNAKQEEKRMKEEKQKQKKYSPTKVTQDLYESKKASS